MHVPSQAIAPTTSLSFAETWHAYTPKELGERCATLGSGQYLIDGILPERALALLIGDSGLGKSPLAYQAAICVAAGVPFLGHSVRQGSVLCIDYENGLAQVHDTLTRLSRYLGLAEVPNNLRLFNFNDSPDDWETVGHRADDLIREVEPDFVIIDSLTAFCPGIEEKNSVATQKIKALRSVIRNVGCSILPIHHIRKPSSRPGEAPESLDKGDARKWFLQARGPRSLINGTDVRIGVDTPSTNCDAALVLRGFGRIRGEIPATYIQRVTDREGDAVGYQRMVGSELLFNVMQEKTFAVLPPSFRFKDAKLAYGKGDQATTDFLKKCMTTGLLHSPGKGRYQKQPE